MPEVDISRALEIPGWMSPLELTWLAERAQEHVRIVEVGCYLGRSTRALADNTTGTVLAVDDWQGPRDVKVDCADLYERFCANLSTRLFTTVFPVRGDSEFLGKIVTGITEMVFLDGDHRYESVKADLEAWARWLIPGGLLCGHDYGDPAHPGVKQAVDEFLDKWQVVPKTVLGTSIWWMGA